MRMDYHIIVISEMHNDARRNAVKGRRPQSIDSFDVTQTILLLGVAETFDMSSRGRCVRSTIDLCVTLNVILSWPLRNCYLLCQIQVP